MTFTHNTKFIYLRIVLFTLAAWKPSQTGVRMATTTMLLMAGAALFPADLEQHLPSVPQPFLPQNPLWMAEMTGEGQSLTHFHTGRISTDANENLHSQLRSNNVIHPGPKTCRSRLKAIALSQFGRKDPDPDVTVIDLIHTVAQTEEPVTITELPVQVEEQQPLPLIQGQVLYYLTGWALFKALKTSKCEACSDYCLSSRALDEHIYHTMHPAESESILTSIRSKGKLVHPSQPLHDLHMSLHHLILAQQQMRTHWSSS